MKAELELNKADIKDFQYADAQGKDEKQIADIRSLVNSGKCDALIVSPNTSAALTPVVEEACKKLPVVTFDRSVNSTCPVTAVQSIGGYAFGKAGADYVAANSPKGAKVLVLRTAPGIDLFETRWEAAKRAFDAAQIKPIGNEFVGADRAKTKAVVADYISRFGKIDAVWVDFGAVSVAVAEAFEDAGQPYPIITGEDQQDYLRAWKANKFKGIAPTYPAYQWRTALLAALKVLKGQPVPGPVWTLPQPVITEKDLPKYVNDKLSPLHYSMCGCEGMPGYPQRWGGKQ
jgi:ribose transport system substrate-binding protein